MSYVYKKCQCCGKEFRCREANSKRVWCSEECRKYLNMKTCPLCGKKFLQDRNKKYCNGPHWKTCPQCGTQFDCTKNPKQTYCSTACRGKYEAENGIRKEISKKSIKTIESKYGVDCAAHIPGVAEKRKQTCLDRYGVDHVWLDTKIQSKRKKTLLDKYGSSGPMRSLEVQQKSRSTCLRKYGVEHPAQNEEVKKKISSHFQNKYGANWAMQVPEFKKKFDDNFIQKYGSAFGTVPEQRKKAEITMLKKYGVKYGPITNQNKENLISNTNKQFAQMLESLQIPCELEFSLPEKSYDLKVGNTLIEIDPTFTHNTVECFNDPKRSVTPDYHLKKSQYANKNNYRCIHVFDWDDWDKIAFILFSVSHKVYARQCKLAKLDKITCDAFLSMYHLQGTCRGQIAAYGMWYNGHLVACMTFGKPRYNKKYEWELLRLCFKPGYKVVGGSERMFTHFIQDVNPSSVISYCDASKFSGEVYRSLGMNQIRFSYPSKHWYSISTKNKPRHITDNFLRQRGYDQIFNEHYGKGTSNEELILNKGYLPVYDCGQYTFAIQF